MADKKEDTNMPHYQEEDELEIDFMEYARKLWKAKKLLLKVAGIAAIIGVVIAFSIPKKYTATITFSPESGKGASNNMSGMAAMLGIGNISMGDANALNISMTSDIVASTPFILELFNTQIKTLDGKQDTTIIAYLATEKIPWWNTLKSLPSRAIVGVISLFTSNDGKVEEKSIDPFQLTPQQMGQVSALKSIITAVPDKKSGMTKLSVTVQDPLVAAMMVDTVLVKLQKYITKYKTSKAQENYDDLKLSYEQSKETYHKAQEEYAKYSDTNKNVILQSVRIEQERLQNEQNLAYQIYNQYATQLQLARTRLQEEKPAFAILEPASVPLYPTGRSKKIIIVGIIFLAVVGAGVWILFGQDLWNSLKAGLSDENTEKVEK